MIEIGSKDVETSRERACRLSHFLEFRQGSEDASSTSSTIDTGWSWYAMDETQIWWEMPCKHGILIRRC